MKKRIADMEPGTVFQHEDIEGISRHIVTGRKIIDSTIEYVETFDLGRLRIDGFYNLEAEIIGRIGPDGRMEKI